MKPFKYILQFRSIFARIFCVLCAPIIGKIWYPTNSNPVTLKGIFFRILSNKIVGCPVNKVNERRKFKTSERLAKLTICIVILWFDVRTIVTHDKNDPRTKLIAYCGATIIRWSSNNECFSAATKGGSGSSSFSEREN